MNIWLSSITQEDIARLEEVFATLTENGWVLPAWLIQMNLLKGINHD